jgi:hypothetical protein
MRDVGARSFDIFGQVLVEAVTLSMVGGLAGAALGIGRWRLGRMAHRSPQVPATRRTIVHSDITTYATCSAS